MDPWTDYLRHTAFPVQGERNDDPLKPTVLCRQESTYGIPDYDPKIFKGLAVLHSNVPTDTNLLQEAEATEETKWFRRCLLGEPGARSAYENLSPLTTKLFAWNCVQKTRSLV